MGVRKVVYYPDDPLTQVAKPVETFDVKLRELVVDMIDTMTCFQGVGLAAPQIGLSKRLFVLQEPEGEPMCQVNPTVHDAEGSEIGEEGCLSMPRIFAMVSRATRIRVEAHDEHGNPLNFESVDFQARIIQHDCDHLEGILFPERLDILTRQDKLEEWELVRTQLLSEEEAATGDAG